MPLLNELEGYVQIGGTTSWVEYLSVVNQPLFSIGLSNQHLGYPNGRFGLSLILFLRQSAIGVIRCIPVKCNHCYVVVSVLAV